MGIECYSVELVRSAECEPLQSGGGFSARHACARVAMIIEDDASLQPRRFDSVIASPAVSRLPSRGDGNHTTSDGRDRSNARVALSACHAVTETIQDSLIGTARLRYGRETHL